MAVLGYPLDSSSGAPIDARYIVTLANDILSNEKIITAGSNITINETSNSVIINSTASGSGAPTSASYVTTNAESDLGAERQLSAGPNITVTDNGANNTVVIGTTGLASNSPSFITVNNESGLTNERRLTVEGGLLIQDNGPNSTLVISGSAFELANQELPWKDPVRVATTANISLSGTQIVDGVSLSVGDRVLVKNQSSGANNGIYIVASGSWTRAADADTSNKVMSGIVISVTQGTSNADTIWVLTTDDPITLGSTSLTFSKFTTPPGGANTQVQFNDSGSFGGDAGLTYNKTTDQLSTGTLKITSTSSGIVAGDDFLKIVNSSGVRIAEIVGAMPSNGNYIQLRASSTGISPGIYAVGTDINKDINLVPTGAGRITINGNASLAYNSTKDACRLATTTALPANTYSSSTKRLTASANGTLSVDGMFVAVDDRILVKNESTGSNNGIYKVIQIGDVSNPYILERTNDFDASAEIKAGTLIFINEGNTLSDTGWVVSTNDPITLDITPLTFDKVLRTNPAGAGTNSDITSMVGLTGELKAPTQITDSNGNELIKFSGQVSAINEFTIRNDPVGGNSGPILQSTGDSANIGIFIQSKGIGNIEFNNSGSADVELLRLLPTTTAVNPDHIIIENADSGNGAKIRSDGSGANVDLKLDPKGFGNVDVSTSRILNVTDGISAQDAATVNQLTTTGAAIAIKQPCRLASTTNLDLDGSETIDGITTNNGDRVLVKDQSTASQNGIYTVNTSGAWSRSSDFDSNGEIKGSIIVAVQEGTVNADSVWMLSTNDSISIGSTSLTFIEITGAYRVTAGNGLTKTGNTLDVGGTTNRISVSADAIDISTNYVGQASITTLGTITTGTWNGTDIAIADGGTGASTAVGARDNLEARWKDPCRLATTANLDLNGSETIDGVATANGDRILVKDQTTGSENGIYIANHSGAWSRATDSNTSSKFPAGTTVMVTEGSTNADTGWTLSTNDPITLGSTSLSFTKVIQAAGGSGAPSNAQYVVMALDGTLTDERRLQANNGVTFSDGGANGDVTLRVATTQKGGIIAGTGASTAAERAPGANGTVLFANSSESTGLEYNVPSYPCDGRLTLTTLMPVATSNDTAKTTVYFTPYCGNRIAIYNGTVWRLYTFSEISIAVPNTTNTNYDVFIYDNAGTLTLETAAWSSDTSRAPNFNLTTQNGVFVKSGATTRRYLGSFRTTGTSGQTENSTSRRFLWNYYHRKRLQLIANDSTDSWTYTTNTWRAANNNTTPGIGRVDFILGYPEDSVQADYWVTAGQSGSNERTASVGLDSTSSPSGTYHATNITDRVVVVGGEYAGLPDAGYHFLQSLEISAANGTTTWFGDNGAGTVRYKSGLTGHLFG